jgi:hypothetical protein
MCIETSAKAGHNVKTLFKKIAMALPGAEAKEDVNTSRSFMYASHARNRCIYARRQGAGRIGMFVLMC